MSRLLCSRLSLLLLLLLLGGQGIHVLVMALRAWLRSGSGSGSGSGCSYWSLHQWVWVLLALLPLLGAAAGGLLNSADDKFYRRYLQLLRLEFDTRLGMHSPR